MGICLYIEKTRHIGHMRFVLHQIRYFFQQPYLVLDLAEQVWLCWVMHMVQNLWNFLPHAGPEIPDKWTYSGDFLHGKFPSQKNVLLQDNSATCKPR